MHIHGLVAIGLCLLLPWTKIAAAQLADAELTAVIAQLEDKDVERRRDAAYELVRRGDHSAAVIGALSKGTADDDTQVRIQALTGLARAGKHSTVAIAQMIQCSRHNDNQVRYRAAAGLGAIGTAAIQPMADHWKSASNESKIALAQALAIIGPEARTTRALLEEGLGGRDALPRYAAEALAAIFPQDETPLWNLLDHEDPNVRGVGIGALARLSTPSEKSLEKLREAAKDSDAKIRETATLVIAKSQLPRDEKAALIELALVDASDAVRSAATVAMLKAKLPEEEFSLRLVGQLNSDDVEIVHSIVKALGMLGPRAQSCLPALVALARDSRVDPTLLSQSIANVGVNAVPELLAAIEQQPACEPILSQALGMIGEPAIAALKEGISSKEELVRVAATRALGGIRPTNTELLQKLVTAVDDPSPTVRAIAISALNAAAKEADFAKADVLKATRDSAANVRAAAMVGLTSFQFTKEESQAAIASALLDAFPEVRLSGLTVLNALPKLVPAHAAQVAALVGDDEATVRAMAAQTLGKLDKSVIQPVQQQALVTSLGDNAIAVRIAATEAVKTLGMTEPEVLEALNRNLIEDRSLLGVTLETLSGFGEKAAPLIAPISHLTSHQDTAVRIAALNALAAIEKDLHTLTGRLTEALDDKEWEVRRGAGIALGKLGPEAKNAVPKLFQLLGSEEDRDFASGALKEINAAPVEAIPLLIEKLDSEERRTAFYAVSLLGKIGPPAAEALPKLESMLANPSGDSSRSDFRKKFLVEAITAIKGQPNPK